MKIVTSNNKKVLVLSKKEWEQIGLKFEEAKKKKGKKKNWNPNPWAVCTESCGRDDKEKYERCIMSVKEKQK